MKLESLPDLLSSDMHREMIRKKWEAEEEEMRSRGPGPLHDQNIKFDGKVYDVHVDHTVFFSLFNLQTLDTVGNC